MANNQQNNSFMNMFPNFGKSQEQVFNEDTQARMAAALTANDAKQERFSGEHAIQDSGAAFGQMLGNYLGKRKRMDMFNAEANTRTRAREGAEKTVTVMGDRGELNNSDGQIDSGLRNWHYQRAVAEEYMKAGDPRGFQLAQELTEQKSLRDKAAAEMAKHDAQGKAAKVKAAAAKSRAETAAETEERLKEDSMAGRFIDISPVGSSNPNDRVNAYIDENGDAWGGGDNGPELLFKLGEYYRERPKDPNSGKSANSSKFRTPEERETDRLMPSKKDAENIRKMGVNLAIQAELGVGLRDVMLGNLQKDGSVPAMGAGGQFIDLATRVVDTARNIASHGLKVISLEDSNGNIVGNFTGSKATASKWAEANKELFHIPEGLYETPLAAAQYRAMVVQLAYIQAQLNEPGTGRLSDADFKNSIRQIGANSTNPEALRRIMFGNLTTNMKRFNMSLLSFPPDIRERIVYKDGMKMWEKSRDEFNTAFGSKTFLTNPQGPAADRTMGADGPLNQQKAVPDNETTEERRARILGK